MIKSVVIYILERISYGLMPKMSRLMNVRQEDCGEFETNLGYIVPDQLRLPT